MVLATRCPNCGTSFRVVPDQIKLRGGWVRCGVCSSTFDGNVSLAEVDLPVAAPAPSAPVVSKQATPHHAPEVVDPIIDHPAVLRTRGAQLPPASDLDLGPPGSAGGQGEPSVPFRADARGKFPQFGAEPDNAFRAGHEPVFGTEPKSEFLVESAVPHAGDREPRFDTSAAHAAPGREPAMVEPKFVIGDDPAARSATPGHTLPGFLGDDAGKKPSRLRRVWIAGAVVALIVALGQAAMLYRTDLASRFPSLRPLLENVCARLQCTVGYPRDLRQLTIESSSLESWSTADTAGPLPAQSEQGGAPSTTDAGTAPADGASQAAPAVRRLALNIVLRNRAKFAQPWPSFELSLTDFSETIVARRVLLPSAYLPPQQLTEPLAAGAERSLRIPIETSEAKASGYRVAVFFP